MSNTNIVSFKTADQKISGKPLDPAIGGDDVIAAGQGNDIVLGGVFRDTIDGSFGDDIILGDNGAVAFSVENNLATLTNINSTDPTLGGSDLCFGLC